MRHTPRPPLGVPQEAEGRIALSRAAPAVNGRDRNKPLKDYEPPGDPAIDWAKNPLPNRDGLLVAAWLTRNLPLRDFILGEVLCTTSRWLLIGETGLGKTLFALELAGAVAAGADFIGWKGRRHARVMYLDGEMPAETFKERIELVAARFGEDIELFGYNRDVLSPDDMPPLNTESGQAWLWREIESVQPDLIIFDSIMCLLSGSMSEEDSWAPVKGLVRKISARRIAQIWVHHSGHDATKGFGTKTREWEMDTVAMLLKTDEEQADSTSVFKLEFRKSRLKTASNHRLFAPKIVRRTAAGFSFEEATSRSGKSSEQEILRRRYLQVYENLADGVAPTPGFDGRPVRKVPADAIRDELKNRGFLDIDEKGQITSASRQLLRRVRADLIGSDKAVLAEADGSIWRIR